MAVRRGSTVLRRSRFTENRGFNQNQIFFRHSTQRNVNILLLEKKKRKKNVGIGTLNVSCGQCYNKIPTLFTQILITCMFCSPSTNLSNVATERNVSLCVCGGGGGGGVLCNRHSVQSIAAFEVDACCKQLLVIFCLLNKPVSTLQRNYAAYIVNQGSFCSEFA